MPVVYDGFVSKGIMRILIFLLCASAWGQTLINFSEVVRKPDGTAWRGRARITNVTTSCGAVYVPSTDLDLDLATTPGQFTVQLYATSECGEGVSYLVRWSPSQGTSTTSRLVIPASPGTNTLRAVTAAGAVPSPALPYPIALLRLGTDYIGKCVGTVDGINPTPFVCSGGSGGSGSVTSVSLSLPGELSVSGSPVTSAGTLSAAWATQTAGKVFAAPAGSAGAPSFRLLVASDIPALSYQAPLGYTPLNAASNLSDLANAGTARTNLGLGTAATQASSAFQPAGSYEAPLTFSAPFSRAANIVSLPVWGSGSRPVAASALGTNGNCVQWTAAGLGDTGSACGSGGGGANALGYYLVSQSANAPANAINLGLLSTGLLKLSISAGVATFTTATAGTDYLVPGDGTTAGEWRMYELAANGSEYRSWMAPDALAAIVRFRFPNAAPTAGQMMTFGAPDGGNISAVSFAAVPAAESTTVSNSGITGANVLKTGTNVTARRIKAGTNITVTENADDIEIAATAGGGSTNQNYRYITWSVDGQGSAITAVTSCKPVDFSGTINQLTATADVSGGVTLDLRTVLHSSYTGPASASSIVNSNPAVLSAAAALTRSAANMSTDGWTTTLAASTDMCLVISSPSTITRLAVAVRVSAN